MHRPQRLRGAYGPPPAVATQPSRSGELPPAYDSDPEPDGQITLLATLTTRGESSNRYGFEEDRTVGRNTGSSGGKNEGPRKRKSKLTASEFSSTKNGDSQGSKGKGGKRSGMHDDSTLRGSNARDRGRGRGKGRSVWDDTACTAGEAKATQAHFDSSSARSGYSSAADPPSTAASSVQADDKEIEEKERVKRLVSLFFSSGGKVTLVSVPVDGILENPSYAATDGGSTRS